MSFRLLSTLALVALLSACKVAPGYRRPVVTAPPAFRGAPAGGASSAALSLGDLKWFEVFRDEQLAALIRRAHARNYDVREAAVRIEASRASLGVTRSDQLPSAGAAVDATTLRMSRGGNFPLPPGVRQQRTFGTVALNLLSYEVDVWGRLRGAAEAAKAEVLAAEENRRAILMTLVGDVASAYFHLLELDMELEIAKRTLATRENSLNLIRLREQRGLATKLEVRQGEQLVQTAMLTIPRIRQLIEQTENRLSLLTGDAPGEITRGLALTAQYQPPEVPAGLPSALLERRPDIRAAERSLAAADAMVGVARAAYFPRISLTGFLGSQTNALSSLFSAPTGMWQFAPQISQPIFTGGRLRSNVQLADAERRLALVRYERAVQTAFREVSDALAEYRQVREVRAEQEALVATLQDRVRLSYVRYKGGVDTLLSALDADRDLFEAELALTRARRDEMVALVGLYRALGGGWQE